MINVSKSLVFAGFLDFYKWLSSVNRWEGGRAKPNIAAMKSIKAFCESHHIDFSNLEKELFGVREETE